jgi:hypothetical protein
MLRLGLRVDATCISVTPISQLLSTQVDKASSRIGQRWGDQSQGTGDIGLGASEKASGIDISIDDSHRQVHSWCPMRTAGPAYRRSPAHVVPGTHLDCRKIRHRYLVTRNRLDGDRPHPGNRPGEGDPTTDRRSHGLSNGGSEVDSPVSRIGPGRGEAGDYGTGHRRR